jgi:hypothetical protein
MYLKRILVSATTAVALGLPGALLAETAADATANPTSATHPSISLISGLVGRQVSDLQKRC